VAGDGEGLVDLASIGALNGNGVVLYTASFADDPKQLRAEIAEPGSLLVVTDSNRKQARRWTGIRDTVGPTERADESALVHDEYDNQLDVFPDAGTDAQTVVQTPGVAVSTSHYGDRGIYQPQYRGTRAFDGDTTTAWEVGAHGKVIGERLRVDLDHSITTDRIRLVQPQVGANDRFVTRVNLRFDGGDPISIDLDDTSRAAEGQTLTFPKQAFHRLEIEIADTNVGDESRPPFANSVGFAEISLQDDAPGSTPVRADEIVRMPTDLVDASSATIASRPLVYSMSRSRSVAIPPRETQDEIALVRRFRVPDQRTFGVRGSARLTTNAPDQTVDAILGVADASKGGITVASSQRLPGDIATRGSSAFDDDASTVWSSAFGAPVGQWLDVTTPAPVTFDHLDLQVVADGKHSVPTQLTIDAGGESRTVDLPAITDGEDGAAPVRVPVSFAPLTGSDVRVTVSGAREVSTLDYHERQPIAMPVAIAEVGLPGVHRAPVPTELPSACRTDLLRLDGAPLPVSVSGSTADAVAGRPLDLAPCEPPATSGVVLGRGDHLVRSAPGTRSGIDVDGLVWGSEADGSSMALGPLGELPRSVTHVASAAGAQPRVKVEALGSTKIELRVTGARRGTPFWLVFGESQNAGWKASVAGDDIGGSTLVDGFANGWRIDPKSGAFDVTLTWTPQRVVWVALAISAVALLGCLVLALWRRVRAPSSKPDAAPPRFENPLVAPGHRPHAGAVVAGALGVGIVGALVASWWVGAVAGALVALVALVPRTRFLVTLGAPAALGAYALYVLVQQHRYDYGSNLDWPQQFASVRELAWLAVLLLLADVVIEWIRWRAPTDS
jgi:hypothetical protein